MTVQTTASRADYTGNGSTTSFTVPFYFLDNTHLTVLRTQISTGTATTLALTTDYTVSGAGVGTGGTITCTTAPTTDQKISILRNVPLTQLSHYVPNDPFPAATHEQIVDQLTMEVQQVNEIASRALQLPANTSGVSATLPTPAGQKVIGWNQYGTALSNYSISDFASTLAGGTFSTQTFSGTGSATSFTLSQTPASVVAVEVFISGVRQTSSIDYIISGTTLTFTSAPPSGTNNIFVRWGSAAVLGYNNASLVNYIQSGTGAITRDTQTKLREAVSVTDFGASPSVSDNSAALQAAINATPAGGKLYIPAGTYSYSTGLTRGSAITIIGDGVSGAGGSTLYYTGTGNAFTYTGGGSASGGRFQDFVLQGTASANNGLYIYNAFNAIRFDKVYVTGFSKTNANACYIEDAWDITFANCTFTNGYNGVKCGIGSLYGVVNACKWIASEFLTLSNTSFSLQSGSANLILGCDFSGQTSVCWVDLANTLATGSNRACNANVIAFNYMEGGTATNDVGIKIGQSATISAASIQGNVIDANYMAWNGDYVRAYNGWATVIRDPKVGTVQAGKKAIIVDSGTTYAKIEWQRRNDITDNGTSTQYITNDLITLTEATGNFTAPVRSAFSAKPTANITNVTGNGATYTVVFNSALKNTQSEYSTTTGIFTAAKAGTYQFDCALQLVGLTGATRINIQLVTTGRTIDLFDVNGSVQNSSNNALLTGGIATVMNAGDTAKINVLVSGMAGNTAAVGSGSYFSGFLIG